MNNNATYPRRVLKEVARYALLLLMSAFVLIPIMWMVSTAFKSEAQTYSPTPVWIPSPVTLDSFTKFFGLYNFGRMTVNSLIACLGSMVICVACSCLSGYGVTRFRFRGKGAFLGFLLITQMFPSVMLVVPFYAVLTKYHLTNSLLGLIIVYMSGEEAGKRFIASQGGGETYEGIDASYFRDRIIITLEDNNKIDDSIRDISQIQGIAEVKAKSELVEGFRTIRRVLNLASAGIIIVLLIVSLFVISNTIKLAMYDRRDEIGIMKMIGATNRFIRFPYFVEGFLIGILSGSVAFFLEWVLYDVFAKQIQRIDSLQLFSIIPFRQLLWPMVIVFGAASLFVGIFGSVMSIRKFLDV